MSEFQEKSLVREVRRLAPDIFRLSLASPRIAGAALPGQFVMVRSGATLDPLLRRPFSIHQVHGSTIMLLFKVIGKGTTLLSRLEPGESVDVIGPLGRGFPLPGDGPVCLVGGGMGIAPLAFLAQRLAAHARDHRDDRVLLGAGSAPELAALAGDFTNLDFSVANATDDGSMGHHGFVTDLLEPILEQTARVYVCGPHPMMAAAATQCRTAGVPCYASLETHMACGLGACLGCTVFAHDGSYRHVCKHGPVFNTDEVAWTL